MNKKEALAALAAGKKVRRDEWPRGDYVRAAPNGDIVMVERDPSGQETATPFAWNLAGDDKWKVVIDERAELVEALHAADELKDYANLRESENFEIIYDYLNRRARELGLQVPE